MYCQANECDHGGEDITDSFITFDSSCLPIDRGTALVDDITPLREGLYCSLQHRADSQILPTARSLLIAGGSSVLLPQCPAEEGHIDGMLEPPYRVVMATATPGGLHSALLSSHSKVEDFQDEPLKKRGRLVNRSSRVGLDDSSGRESVRAAADESTGPPSPVLRAPPADTHTPMAHATLVPSDGCDGCAHPSSEQDGKARVATPQHLIASTAATVVTAEAAASDSTLPLALRRSVPLHTNTTISPPYKLTQLPSVPVSSVGLLAVPIDSQAKTKPPSARWSFASFLPSSASTPKLPPIKSGVALQQGCSKLRAGPYAGDDVPAPAPAPSSDTSAGARASGRVSVASPWGWKRPAAVPALDADAASRAVRAAARLFASSRVKSHSSAVSLQPITVCPQAPLPACRRSPPYPPYPAVRATRARTACRRRQSIAWGSSAVSNLG